ncbi:MAG TPA: LysR substrate-binding domain-containing protein, partial [Ilumatobacter sp.]|nr:LysR substrate-binding domain-containing protein [Ilumatobacter sp.]
WEAIKLVVAEGDAVAAVSRMAIAVEQAAGTLIQLQVKGWRLGRPISVVRHADLPLSPLAVAFLTELQQHAIG